MKKNRAALAVAALGLALAGAASPAMAAPRIDPGGPPNVRTTAPTARSHHIPTIWMYPRCVTTTWRAQFTHKPKTRVGQVCRATPGMWLPSSYVLVGYWVPNMYAADADWSFWPLVERVR